MPDNVPAGLSLDFNADIVPPKTRPPPNHSKNFQSNEGALKTFAHFATVANRSLEKEKDKRRNSKWSKCSTSSTSTVRSNNKTALKKQSH